MYSFMQHVTHKCLAAPDFVIGNFLKFVNLFRENGLPLKQVDSMTPFIETDFQMSDEPVERELRGLLISPRRRRSHFH